MLKCSSWMIIVNRDGNVLLTRRSPKVNNPGLYNFAGGKVDKGEKSKKAAVRESKEEVGIKIPEGDVIKLASIKTDREKMTFYKYEGDYPEVKHNEEVDKYVWVPPYKLSAYPLHRPTFLFVRRYLNALTKAEK